MTLDARADRTQLRLQLYNNGFTPLPNRSKLCLLKGWSTIEVTPDLIRSREWARSKSFSDTGIRCGEVVSLDWDIDDPELLNKLLDAVVEQGLVAESPFIRIGRAPRELWVYRTSDKIGKRTTGHFSRPGAGEDETGYAVEILGAGCQFAAYGQRDEATAYAWPEQSLADHPYMDLPEITLKQVDALKDFCALFFEMHGLVRRSPAGGTDHGYTHAYDLTADMQFEVKDMGVLSVAEMTDVLRVNPDEVLRCRVDALRPTTGSWAGMASLVGGALCISDHGTYTSHFPPDQDLGQSMTRLGALLAERFPEAMQEPKSAPVDLDANTPGLDTRQSLDENLGRALRRYVYVHDLNVVIDIRYPRAMMTVEHLRNAWRGYHETKLGPKGADLRVWLYDLWMDSPVRVLLKSVGLRPDMPWPVYEEEGERHLNTYRPLDLPTHGDPRIGWTFIENLLPIPSERHFFIQWLSSKLCDPKTRGPGVVMVAHDQYGTGRGSLVALIRAMVAEPLVRTIDFKTLSGQTYQSQYNEWLVDSLFAVVNEAKETLANTSSWQTRNNAYEHLKAIIDPGENHTEVLRKGGKNGPGRTFCSILVLTNHMDSVVLPHNDRRLAILENGSPMPEEYWIEFRRWLAVPANVGAFREELMAYDKTGYNAFAAPPMTAAKAEMVEAGTSEMDRAMAAVLAGMRDTVAVRDQVLLKLEDYIADNAVDMPEDWRRIAERLFLRSTRKLPANLPERCRIDSRQRVVRMIGRPPPEVLQSAETVLEAVQRNGPVVRPMRSGNVVSFQQR